MSRAEASHDSSLGQLLKDARERRGLTLRQVSSDTKIPLRHLEAFERDDLGALPPGFYLRGQLRACAKAVHLDPDLALIRLDRLLESETDTVVQALPPTPSPAPRRRPRLPAVAAFVVCAVAAAIWLWRQQPAPVNREPVTPPPEPQPAQIDGHAGSDAVTGTTLQTAPLESQAAPARSATFDAQLVVTTEPAGARVTVNGIGWGTSPVTIPHLPPGDKRVRVSLDGYLTAERGVSLTEGQAGTVSIRLRRAP